MFNKAKEIKEKYLRKEMWPSIFCTGCGIGNVLNYTLRAIDSVKLDIDRVVFCSGIGCSSRLPGYIEADGLHTTHGRAIAFATGVKLAAPDLNVVVFTGDGDLAGIGGNHFIHAARRNIDLLVILVNNFIYGMTGGQNAPTTPLTARIAAMKKPTVNRLYYILDWGDGKVSGLIGPYNSGETAEASHKWNKKGDYEIRVKSKDEYAVESEWSDSLPISMPKVKSFKIPDINLLQKLIDRFPLFERMFKPMFFN